MAGEFRTSAGNAHTLNLTKSVKTILVCRLLGKPLMKTPRLGANFAVFLLFFGVATLEAFQSRNWLKAGFWLAIGIVFLVADNLHRQRVRD